MIHRRKTEDGEIILERDSSDGRIIFWVEKILSGYYRAVPLTLEEAKALRDMLVQELPFEKPIHPNLQEPIS